MRPRDVSVSKASAESHGSHLLVMKEFGSKEGVREGKAEIGRTEEEECGKELRNCRDKRKCDCTGVSSKQARCHRKPPPSNRFRRGVKINANQAHRRRDLLERRQSAGRKQRRPGMLAQR